MVTSPRSSSDSDALLHAEAVALARREVLERTWAMSRQIFERQVPVLDDGVPRVELVETETLPGSVIVSFPMADEPYFFQVRVDVAEGAPTLAMVGCSPATRAYLSISSAELSAEAITQHLGLDPTRTRAKGTPFRGGERLRAEHEWDIEPMREPAVDLERKVQHLLEIIRASRDALASLPASCTLELQLVSRQWQAWTRGLSLDPCQVALLGEVRAGLSFDVSVSGPDMSDVEIDA